MTCIFVQIRCKPGTAYKVAEQFVQRELHSEIYSTSGDYDLLAKLYVGEDQDCLLYTSPSPRDRQKSRMPSSA